MFMTNLRLMGIYQDLIRKINENESGNENTRRYFQRKLVEFLCESV